MEYGDIYSAFKKLVMSFGVGGHDMFEFIEKYLDFLTKI
jgi:hypothetical protein